MAMTARIVAFAEQSSVLFVGKCRDVQAMCGAEADLHSQKHAPISPCFSKKICPFMQSHSVNRNRCRHPFSNRSEERRVGKEFIGRGCVEGQSGQCEHA